ncbi:integral membrane protein 2C-like [Dreissena polymorpha]|uniref:Integral membrane protein 2 n=1 Tax=Dreissena polymorpha TaxID=45954 RepID=A0A9D4FZT3_DREPO|nr:integral membrane protein 2C-like [Dreissena polymorpha]KAH3805950.1 hypothetical protein DPMN_134260 [Dreissena polymorpha]
MTIIKITKDGKFVGKKKADEVIVPLHPEGAREVGVRQLNVDYHTTRKTRTIVNVFLVLMALLVLATGVVGGVYLYKYMAHKHHKQEVTVQYDDPVAMAVSSQTKGPATPGDSYSFTMVQEVDIEMDMEVERIDVPDFDDCRRSLILHDFPNNYTAIIDVNDQECFIMDLDRTQMKPPRSFAELVEKYTSGYYTPRLSVVRQEYQVVLPKMADAKFAGPAIAAECIGLDVYRLEKRQPTPILEIQFTYVKTYGFSNLEQVIKDQIFK